MLWKRSRVAYRRSTARGEIRRFRRKIAARVFAGSLLMLAVCCQSSPSDREESSAREVVFAIGKEDKSIGEFPESGYRGIW
jgi:hypothetical protein